MRPVRALHTSPHVVATRPGGAVGHHTSGIVAGSQVLAGIATGRELGTPVPLRRGLALLPIAEENIAGLIGSDPDPPLLACEYLTPALLAALSELSADCRLACIETDHHGGTGGQGALVRDEGNVVMRPVCGDGPRGRVSRALAHPGVRAGPRHTDEFDAVGLGAIRSNRAWRRASTPR